MSIISELRDLSIQGVHIQTYYSEYLKKRFLVNRKYQRKLAWTIDEKRNFIDTLIKGLPIPLFLVAEVQFSGETKLEVIDGMQRLDAIFSFIEQKYSLKDGFFDLSIMADTLALLKEGKITQREPKLDEKTCRKIVNYLIPVSKASALEKGEIEETFRRINSNGRHLSSQELRQAGATGKFPDLVRRLSAFIRGDISRDSLVLNDMSKISLTNKRLEYYGINVYDTFWVKNNILTFNQIRESIDEELIGYIISNMILDKKDNYNNHALDSLYGFTSNPLAPTPLGKSKIEDAIDRVSEQVVERNFLSVYSTIDDLMVKNNKKFRDLIYKNSSTFDHVRAFQAVFMAFYTLIVKQSKKVVNEAGLISELTGIGDDLLTSNTIHNLSGWKFQDKTVRAIIGRIQNNFAENEIIDPAYDDWSEQITNILMQSLTEQNLYDFKIGVFNINDESYNHDLILKIAKTLSAINNAGPDRVGYLILGIADKKEDAEKHKRKYGLNYVSKHDFHIAGVEAEANRLAGGLDKYLHKIKESLKTAPVQPTSFLQMILSNMSSRRYYGKEVIIFKTSFNEPVWYDGELFERFGSHNEKVELVNRSNIYNRFYQK